MNAARETFLRIKESAEGARLAERGGRKLSGERIAAGRISEMNSSPDAVSLLSGAMRQRVSYL